MYRLGKLFRLWLWNMVASMQHPQEHHSHWLGCLSSLHSAGEILSLYPWWKASVLHQHFRKCRQCHRDSCRVCSKCGSPSPVSSLGQAFANTPEGCLGGGSGRWSLIARRASLYCRGPGGGNPAFRNRECEGKTGYFMNNGVLEGPSAYKETKIWVFLNSFFLISQRYVS